MVARRNEPNHDTPRRNGMPLREVAENAVCEFTSLFGQPAYRVTGVRRSDDDGWSVLVDVVELERIPQSTSLLATYRVDVDNEGQLVSYQRLRRFTLGAADPS
jgi:Gas vesicle synthesis protein GvpO